jgi:hypothetical protein
MRLYRISPADAERAARLPFRIGVDERGNPRLTGLDCGGRAIIVIVANDDPDFVITTFPDA